MQLWSYRPYTEGCAPTGRVPVLLNTVEGVRSLDEVLDDTARCFRMRRRSRLVHLVLRGSVEALRDLTFGIAVGELVCIVGPSGAGKTTLLRCISGLLEPTSGEVVLQGEQVTGPPRGMAVVFQEYGRSLFPWMTVRQNVELPLKEKKVPRAERRRLVEEALEAVGLADVHTAHPWQLSGGMQQRVAIARALPGPAGAGAVHLAHRRSRGRRHRPAGRATEAM